MKRDVLIDGRPETIDVVEANGLAQFVMGGRSGSASIVEVEPRVFSILLDGASYLAQVTRIAESLSVEVRGRVFTIEITDPRAPRRKTGSVAGEGRQTIAAPMPGKIVRLLVSEGASVEAGQGIVVMEAMKMQNELKALRPGTVTSLPASEGVTVTAGEILAVIE
jgi:biotin carboxyl carrier protein